jgi:hypothetical protein
MSGGLADTWLLFAERPGSGPPGIVAEGTPCCSLRPSCCCLATDGDLVLCCSCFVGETPGCTSIGTGGCIAGWGTQTVPDWLGMIYRQNFVKRSVYLQDDMLSPSHVSALIKVITVDSASDGSW